MDNDTTCDCGAFIPRGGRGRPRKFCTDCRPPVKVAPRPPRINRCATCGEAIPARFTYCGDRCMHLPCDACGEPTAVKRSFGTGSARHKSCCEPPEHGTAAAYRRGCRCRACKDCVRIRHRDYRAKRRGEGRPVKRFGGSGPWIAESVRVAVFERDAWVCQLCGDPTDRNATPNSDWFPSLDHIVPASKGGPHTFENLRVAHRWCNSVRGAEDHHSELFKEAAHEPQGSSLVG